MATIVFLGSPKPAVYPLESLVNAPSIEVLAVVSQPAKPSGRGKKLLDPPVAVFAKKNKIQTLQPSSAKDPEFLSWLKDLKPDFCITAAYGQILTQEFLDIPKFGTLNIHPSLIPKYRGATPIPSALLNGDTKTGVSILQTVRKMDAGPIVLQKEYNIDPKENCGDLMNRLFQESGEILIEAIHASQQVGFKPILQNEDLVTHCSKFSKSDGKIDWNSDAETISNRFRAFQPWPGVFTEIEDLRISVEDLRLPSEEELESLSVELSPGEMHFQKRKSLLFVGCKNGSKLVLNKLKPAGKKCKSSVDFWNELKSKGIKRFETV